MRKVLCLLLVVITYGAVVSAAKDKDALEKKVAIVMNSDHVKNCKLIHLVEAKTRATLFTGYTKNKRAYVKLREKALEMGGNTVLLFESKNDMSRTRLMGEVYLCPPQETEEPTEPGSQ